VFWYRRSHVAIRMQVFKLSLNKSGEERYYRENLMERRDMRE
jgi:hypothetical protein